MSDSATFIGVATNVKQILYALKTYTPENATIEMASTDFQYAVEIWYDKDTNIVILK